jgi:hypothetical protein
METGSPYCSQIRAILPVIMVREEEEGMGERWIGWRVESGEWRVESGE